MEYKKGLSKLQYWIVIFITLGLLLINGYLVLKLVNNEVEFDLSCPVPVDKIERCECKYNSLNRQQIEYCYCYPIGSNITSKISKINNFNISFNLSELNQEVDNGTGRNN